MDQTDQKALAAVQAYAREAAEAPRDRTALASSLARLIDHTLLRPTATDADVEALCDEAAHYQFASVCVSPTWVPLARERLAHSPVRVCTVVGFPHGAHQTSAKAYEAKEAARYGADELDMVIPIGRLKCGHHDAVEADVRSVVEAVPDQIVKVIVETALLTDEEKQTAARLSQEAGAHFVKTSTGFGGGGATVEDVALLRETVGSAMGVKASGGIKTVDDALALVQAGATRLGASAGVSLIKSLSASAV